MSLKLADIHINRKFKYLIYTYFHEQVSESLSDEEPWDMFIPREDLEDHNDCTNFWS